MEKLYNYLQQDIRQELENTPIAQEAQAFYAENTNRAECMFGYPSNNVTLSPLTQYLLLRHYNSPFSNNCGDVEERGNYALDTKDIERRIVQFYADKFGMGDTPWGYVTSGGSESNSCGIALAYNKYPNGIVYYSQSAHYSVEKFAKLYRRVEIPTKPNDVLDLDILFAEILKNFRADGSPANLILTHGTTKYGECDDVDTIVTFLNEHKIPHYIHLDAALYGGIPNNQHNAPLIRNAKERGIDSVCVSMHKYLGFPDVHSVFVSTKKPQGRAVAYIGQRDTTVSGSRSIPAFALYNHILEQEHGQTEDTYEKNILYFEERLQALHIPYYRAPLANIFVIDKPSTEACKEFQLSCFFDSPCEDDVEKAHILIFPHHTKQAMEQLLSALQEYR